MDVVVDVPINGFDDEIISSLTCKVLREMHAVVGRKRLFTEGRYLEGLLGIETHEPLEELAAHHAVSNHYDSPLRQGL